LTLKWWPDRRKPSLLRRISQFLLSFFLVFERNCWCGTHLRPHPQPLTLLSCSICFLINTPSLTPCCCLFSHCLLWQNIPQKPLPDYPPPQPLARTTPKADCYCPLLSCSTRPLGGRSPSFVTRTFFLVSSLSSGNSLSFSFCKVVCSREENPSLNHLSFPLH